MFGMMEGIYAFLSRMIGTRNDSPDPTGSLHAKATDIKNTVSNLNTGLNSKIGTSSDSRANNTLMGFASTQVKSVQRGVATMGQAVKSVSVSISSVNLNKSIIIPAGTKYSPYDVDVQHFGMGGMASIQFNGANALTIDRMDGWGTIYVAWQVIEFY